VTVSSLSTGDNKNRMTRPIALAALFLSTILIAVAYVGALVASAVPVWAPWALMIGTSTVMLATMVLGASRAGASIGRLTVPFAAMFLVLVVGFGAVLVMPPEAAGSPLWFGLPARAAVVLYGIGVLPLFVLPIAYALTFESLTLSDADLERVRAACRARVEA
jgi:hypothetical protein